uniref:Uncharacterized protein n=1 Tax=Chromera velia CCMP2878 TaxID=1169474 RepID=A0A0G4ICV4_9ALVE|eukprot:Cvel_13158.t1-p1 / transcript=Cvel_13158.t1 / gene=Cvel_13158 / organism=Chromera_velia_CCMP2878 / gene_product=hypothetical protein / transcript_product=hypothetical protein / location=Cvel_scaffold888:33182-33571(+) / protein_length=130 / sequence_SO=supercontig / SO=protein_coding / is_pseudo=false
MNDAWKTNQLVIDGVNRNVPAGAQTGSKLPSWVNVIAGLLSRLGINPMDYLNWVKDIWSSLPKDLQRAAANGVAGAIIGGATGGGGDAMALTVAMLLGAVIAGPPGWIIGGGAAIFGGIGFGIGWACSPK